jgi:hypothetical protein
MRGEEHAASDLSARGTAAPGACSDRRHVCGGERAPLGARGEPGGEGERRGQGESPRGTAPRSSAPLEADRAWARARGAVWAGGRHWGVVLESGAGDVLGGAEGLQPSIEPLPRPREPRAQPRDEDAIGVVADARVGGVPLRPARVRLEEAGALLVRGEPGPAGRTDGGGARGGQAARRRPPVQSALVALAKVVGEAHPAPP